MPTEEIMDILRDKIEQKIPVQKLVWLRDKE